MLIKIEGPINATHRCNSCLKLITHILYIFMCMSGSLTHNQKSLTHTNMCLLGTDKCDPAQLGCGCLSPHWSSHTGRFEVPRAPHMEKAVL